MKTSCLTEQTSDFKVIVNFLSNIPLFDELAISELEVLSERMSLIELDAGEILFEEWETGDFVCFVENGSFELLKKSGVDTYSKIAILGRGKSIGEMSIIDNFLRSATLKAISPGRVITFSRQLFENITATHPHISIRILKSLARLLGHNLRKTSSRLADYMMPMG